MSNQLGPSHVPQRGKEDVAAGPAMTTGNQSVELTWISYVSSCLPGNPGISIHAFPNVSKAIGKRQFMRFTSVGLTPRRDVMPSLSSRLYTALHGSTRLATALLCQCNVASPFPGERWPYTWHCPRLIAFLSIASPNHLPVFHPTRRDCQSRRLPLNPEN